jgi:hypothetical protein
MNRIYVMVVLLVAQSAPILAQRLDGCPAQASPSWFSAVPSREAVDRGLQGYGVGATRDALTLALRDPQADVRSLAALKLGHTAKAAGVDPLFKAWLLEEDDCTKGLMEMSLSTLVGGLAEQHPSGQYWVTPFQECTAPEPPLVTLTIEQVRGPGITGPTVRVSARNQTQETLPFVKAPPQQLYSASVLGPAGANANIVEARQSMYKPGGGPLFFHGATFVALPPHEDVPIWTWSVGDDFDMSAPGTYRVSLGGRIDYLNTTVCSNTALVTVEK